jgi:hypothetical protein
MSIRLHGTLAIEFAAESSTLLREALRVRTASWHPLGTVVFSSAIRVTTQYSLSGAPIIQDRCSLFVWV